MVSPISRADGWLALSASRLAGLNSARAKPVQERIPETYVALGREEAERLGLAEGKLLRLSVKGHELRLPLRISEELGAGLVALPAGLAGIPAGVFGGVAEGLQEAAQ